MKALSFELGGKTAFFKKPDVNSYAYFTYNNIHKPTLLGLLGAIVGLGGYNKLYWQNRGLKKGKLGYNDGFPEYYEKLKGLKISIVPLSQTGYFTKKNQIFNNSVGYASFEQGGNLIIKEQWLENPKWQIIILDNQSEVFEKIKEYLFHTKTEFIPYLGKNDHPATIKEVKEINLTKAQEIDCVHSLFMEKKFEIFSRARRDVMPFIFKESAPISLQKEFHFYENENLIFTNQKVQLVSNYEDIYSMEDKNYFFF